ncbi:MAG: VanW family protein [Oscillospiraceae bacterium]|nr:VanW family protein [Oscillospiraceae bacterium]
MSQAVAEKKVKPKPARVAPARKFRFKPFSLVLLSVIGSLLIALSAASVFTLTYDRVFPGISAFGIDLSGMTRGEASLALAAERDAVYAGAAVTLTLDDQSIVITAEDARIRLSAEDAVDAVYNMGREGGVFSRLSFAFSSLVTERALENEHQNTSFYIDEEAVFAIVSSFSDAHFRPAEDYSWSIGDAAISVTSGRDGAVSSPKDMAGAVVSGFTVRDFSPLSYLSESVPPKPLPLDELHREIFVEPRDASVTLDEDGNAFIMPHVVGVSFDMQAARDALARSLDRFSIPLLFTTPDLTDEALDDSLFADLLGAYSTSTSGSSQNRIGNVSISAQAMSGTIILPGESFSFNDVVGPRSSERGYLPAGAYLNGQVVQEIGGGICQTSTTLYNAVLLANLQIVYRQSHSMTVWYVPLGLDAAVSWGRFDFIFSNDTPYPIRVVSWYERGRLTAEIWGTKTDDLTVVMESDIIAHRPAQTTTVHNPELAPGASVTKISGSDGWTVQTYRVLVDPDGNEVYRNPEARTGYIKFDAIIEVGTPPTGDLPSDPTPIDPIPPPDPGPGPIPSPDPTPTPTPDPDPDPPPDPELPAASPDPDLDLDSDPNPDPGTEPETTPQPEDRGEIDE